MKFRDALRPLRQLYGTMLADEFSPLKMKPSGKSCSPLFRPVQVRKRKAKQKRQAAERYDRRSYRQVIVRACKAAKVPPWSPLQLRHTVATLLRAKYGIEAAKVILGHTRVETSQIYAEKDMNRAREFMHEIG